MKRLEMQVRLTKSIVATEDSSTVFCVESLASVERDGGERLGRLLAKLIRDPENAWVVAMTDAFVFAFANRQGQRVDRSDVELGGGSGSD